LVQALLLLLVNVALKQLLQQHCGDVSQTTSLNYLRHHLRLAEVSNRYLTCLFEVRI
jgi:hypothetical protein